MNHRPFPAATPVTWAFQEARGAESQVATDHSASASAPVSASVSALRVDRPWLRTGDAMPVPQEPLWQGSPQMVSDALTQGSRPEGVPMRVYLTFDTEVWCDGWHDLDTRFAEAFERYILGRSSHGEYGLPWTLQTLQHHGLQGVFFVEPLFSARVGERWLHQIVQMIDRAGQDVQLHLHPEWVAELPPGTLPVANAAARRPHLRQFSLEDQTHLIGWGRHALERALGRRVQAFRAGNFGVNRDTYVALERLGLGLDSSLNACVDGADPVLTNSTPHRSALRVGQVFSVPVTVFRDGLGRQRPAHLTACSYEELHDALFAAHEAGCEHFVIVSHSFELLKRRRSEPDRRMLQRFTRLCALLDRHRQHFQVGRFHAAGLPHGERQPVVSRRATARRLVEQALRRLG